MVVTKLDSRDMVANCGHEEVDDAAEEDRFCN